MNESNNESLRYRKCVCGDTMTEVIKHQQTYDVQVPVRIGWYCKCKKFVNTIGRERKVSRQ